MAVLGILLALILLAGVARIGKKSAIVIDKHAETLAPITDINVPLSIRTWKPAEGEITQTVMVKSVGLSRDKKGLAYVSHVRGICSRTNRAKNFRLTKNTSIADPESGQRVENVGEFLFQTLKRRETALSAIAEATVTELFQPPAPQSGAIEQTNMDAPDERRRLTDDQKFFRRAARRFIVWPILVPLAALTVLVIIVAVLQSLGVVADPSTAPRTIAKPH